MPSFEDQLAALEAVVAKLERGDLPLDESVRLFEEGVRLSDACKHELDAAEGKIQVLLHPGPGPVRLAPLNLNEEDKEAADDQP